MKIKKVSEKFPAILQPIGVASFDDGVDYTVSLLIPFCGVMLENVTSGVRYVVSMSAIADEVRAFEDAAVEDPEEVLP